MASSSVNISDTELAVASGEIPGAFADGRLAFAFPTLCYTGARGAARHWAISVRATVDGAPVAIAPEMLRPGAILDAGTRAEITVESAQDGGKVRDVVPTYVSVGKNLGKKNATNAVTQAFRDALGVYLKHLKRAAAEPCVAAAAAAPAAAAPAAAAAPDMPPPMLVQKLGASREAALTPADFADGVTVQRKYDGVHFVVGRRADGRLVMYSRSGTEYPGHAQIAAEMGALYAAWDAAPGAAPGATQSPYFAGELYKHGKELNWISGQARRADDEGLLEYHIFDMFEPLAGATPMPTPSRDRQAYIDRFMAADVPHPHVFRVENFPARDMAEVEALAARFLEEKYEGAIARKDSGLYTFSYNGHHSPAALKIKPIHDSEYEVVGFTQGTRGKDVGALIWICTLPPDLPGDDRLFNVVPKNMTYEMRYCLFKLLSAPVGAAGETRFERDIRGLPLTIEYAGLSAKTGKPLQAKARVFRTYDEGGPGHDAVQALMAECAASQL